MSTALFRISLSLGRFFFSQWQHDNSEHAIALLFGKSEAAHEITRGGRPSFQETQVVTSVPLVFLGHPSGHTGVTLVPILRTKGRPNVQSPPTPVQDASAHGPRVQSQDLESMAHGSSLHGSAQRFGLQHPTAQAKV